MIKTIAKALVALNSNVRTEQIAAGAACGVLLGLVPAGNLLWIGLFVVILFFKINYAFQLAALALCKLLAPLAALLTDPLGWAILNASFLGKFFTWLYNAPAAPLTRFNNSLVMGGLAAGAVLWLPVFFGVRGLVPAYRNKLAPRIADSKAFKAVLKMPLAKALAGAVASASKLAKALD